MNDAARQAEIKRYEACYKHPKYKMGEKRKAAAREVLANLPLYVGGDYVDTILDVGAGRGELGALADELNFRYCGVEPVPYLATDRIITGIATALPFADKTSAVVCCLDVLEHLIEADILPALAEFKRVARTHVFLTASERASRCSVDGRDLHISKRPLADWHRMFVSAFPGSTIKQLGMIGVSPGWLIEL